VGQAELDIVDLVDVLVVVLLPNAGDELTTIKHGVLRHADLVVVNKADDHLEHGAQAMAEVCRQALPLFGLAGEHGSPAVVTTSARDGKGIEELWDGVEQRFAALRDGGRLTRQRRHKLGRAFLTALTSAAASSLKANDSVRRIRERVVSGDLAFEEGLALALDCAPPVGSPVSATAKKQ
jgi:LAO/AO transport system kinase